MDELGEFRARVERLEKEKSGGWWRFFLQYLLAPLLVAAFGAVVTWFSVFPKAGPADVGLPPPGAASDETQTRPSRPIPWMIPGCGRHSSTSRAAAASG